MNQTEDQSVKPGRLAGVDIARGLAMLGMTTVHAEIGYDDEPGRLASWLISMPSGRASVLFFTLSGVALSIIAGRGSASADNAVLRRRGLLLLVGGWFLMATFWPNSILHQYGAMFLLAPTLLRRRTRTLVALAAVAFLAGPLVGVLGSWLLEPWTYGWESSFDYPVTSWVVTTVHDALFGQYALVVWVGFFMVGVALGRCRFTARRGALMVLGGALACVAVTVPFDAANRALGYTGFEDETSEYTSSDDGGWFNYLPEQESVAEIAKTDVDSCETYFQWDEQWYDDEGYWDGPSEPELLPDFDPTDCYADKVYPKRAPIADVVSWDVVTSLSPHADTTGWALQSLAIAIAVLGLCLVLPRFAQRVLSPLAAVGSMSLTIYVLHTALVQDWWHLADHVLGDGLAADGWTLLSVFAIELAVASLIRWRFSRGPLEWLLGQFSGGPRRSPSATPAEGA